MLQFFFLLFKEFYALSGLNLKAKNLLLCQNQIYFRTLPKKCLKHYILKSLPYLKLESLWYIFYRSKRKVWALDIVGMWFLQVCMKDRVPKFKKIFLYSALTLLVTIQMCIKVPEIWTLMMFNNASLHQWNYKQNRKIHS